MENFELNPVQKEILKAFDSLSAKALVTEAILAKKIRENTKFEGKKKAGLGMGDLEKVLSYLEEKESRFYSLHLNSANDLLIKKDETTQMLSPDAKRRRQSSEKSMTIFTSADFSSKTQKTQKKSCHKKDSRHKDFGLEDLD